MKLNYQARKISTKGAVAALRRDGRIPGIIYKGDGAGEPISVERAEYEALLRQLKSGHLSVTVLELTDEAGKVRKALVKDIDYERTTYNVLHLDFEELQDDKPVTVRVPIELIGSQDCKGVKLGGFLRQIIRAMRVRCLPKDIPTQFELNVRNLEIKQTLRLSDMQIPSNVTPRARLEEVAVVVAKK